jgi:C4-dicarboxylate transporter DctQ subunit
MKTAFNWFQRISESISAAMLAALFIAFILQIFSRYILNDPISWTVEACLTIWVWLVFWSNSFVVKHDEHITFDLLYFAVKPNIRRVFALIGSLAIMIGIAVSIYPTWDWIDFLRIKKSTILYIPMRTVFSIYLIFMVATFIIYLVRFIRVTRGEDLDEQAKIADEEIS